MDAAKRSAYKEMTHIALRVIPLAILVTISAASYASYENFVEEKIRFSIPSMYARADLLESHGNKYDQNITPLEIYSRIIEIDVSQEDAWHEKGRLLNHHEMCDESVTHWKQYVGEFPDSYRAVEGYDIAMKCGETG